MNPTSVPQGGLAAILAEADQYMFRYDFQGAAQFLERARRVEPDNDQLLVKLGAAYAKGYDFSSAERSFEEGIRVSTQKTDALMAAGHHWLEVRHFEAAKHCFERILQKSDHEVPCVTFIRLADIYVRMRRLDDAVKIADRALKIYRSHEGALLARAKVHAQMKQPFEAEKILRWLLTRPEYKGEIRAYAYYELAALQDQHGDYDQAMSSLVEGKKLLLLPAAQPMKILRMKQETMRKMRQQTTEALLQKWRKFGTSELQPRRKLALLCGHARSGTTLLEYVLDSHPDIISAEESQVFHNVAYYPMGKAVGGKGTSIFSALDWMSPRTMRQIRAEYFRGIETVLGETVGERMLVDKNPANTFDLAAILRIFPETKFLVAMRDPRDVVLSSFMQPASLLPDTTSWLTLEGTIVHYGLIMGLWVAAKSGMGDSAIEVRYEDLVQNMEGTARRVLDFLGCKWDDRVLHFDEHARKEIVRSPTFADVTKPVYKSSVARWRHYQKYFEPHMEKLAPYLKEFGYE